MHNGVLVQRGSYYGETATVLLELNRGVHEPQEERIFQEVLPYIPAGGSILELGAYWGFHSIWFACLPFGQSAAERHPPPQQSREPSDPLARAALRTRPTAFRRTTDILSAPTGSSGKGRAHAVPPERRSAPSAWRSAAPFTSGSAPTRLSRMTAPGPPSPSWCPRGRSSAAHRAPTRASPPLPAIRP